MHLKVSNSYKEGISLLPILKIVHCSLLYRFPMKRAGVLRCGSRMFPDLGLYDTIPILLPVLSI